MEGLILRHDFYVTTSVLGLFVHLPMLLAPLLIQNVFVVIDFVGLALLTTFIVEVSCDRGHHAPGENVRLNYLADIHRVYLPVLIRAPDQTQVFIPVITCLLFFLCVFLFHYHKGKHK